jgi:hypothetical protein
MYLWVPCLSIFQDLANKVHQLLLDFCSSCSIAMTVITTASKVATYSSSTSLGFGGTSVGRVFRYCLSSLNAAAT